VNPSTDTNPVSPDPDLDACVLATVVEHPGSSGNAIREHLGRDAKVVTAVLRQLVAAGQLERRGTGRTTGYWLWQVPKSPDGYLHPRPRPLTLTKQPRKGIRCALPRGSTGAFRVHPTDRS
jgi:hypothetical protein